MDDTYSKLVDIAYDMHISGRLNEAKEVYEKLLCANPSDINVQNLYAQLNVALKNYDIALNYFNNIYELTQIEDIKINIAKVYFYKEDYENSIIVLNSLIKQDLSSLKLLALSYLKQKKYNDCVCTYLEIEKNNQLDFSDLFNISISYFELKNINQSLKYAQDAYNLSDMDIDINSHLAFLYEKNECYENAILHLDKVFKITNNIEVAYRIGVLYKKINKIEKALEYFYICLSIDENDKNSQINIALIHSNSDKNKSIEILEKLRERFHNDILILNYLFKFYNEMYNFENAYKISLALIECDKTDSYYYSIAADSLISMYRYDEAEIMYKKALELEPQDSLYCESQIAYIYSITGRVKDAISILKKNLQIDSINFDYTYIQCREKNLKEVREGFYKRHNTRRSKVEIEDNVKKLFYKLNIGKKYAIDEREFLSIGKNIDKKTEEPITSDKNNWKDQNITGKKLLVKSFHGVGDLIMCSRYIKPLINKVSKLIIYIPSSCERLFKYNFSNIDVVTIEPNESEYDYKTTFMHLLYNLNIDFNNIEFSKGYLFVDDSIVKEKSQLDILKTNKQKIGIYWQGNPTILVNRSINLKYLLPLFELEESQIYSFQISKVDFESEELKKKLNIIDLAPFIQDYFDTAAFLKNIDVLVTIDTSIAHLAGAMGVKTYLLLPFDSEWRWFYDTKTTPWYDSVRVFKQKIPNDWNEVIQRVKNELAL